VIQMPLTACHVGDEGVIAEVVGDCNMSKRLDEMGVHAGARVRIARDGAPIIIELDESRICLRAELADSIILSVVPAGSPVASTTPLPHRSG